MQTIDKNTFVVNSTLPPSVEVIKNTHAEVCPVCKGSGKYVYQNGAYIGSTGSYCQYTRTCHGCDGKGWIVLVDGYSCPLKSIGPTWTCK